MPSVPIITDLCGCIAQQFAQELDTVESILRSVSSGQEVVTSQGFSDSTTAFNLPPRPTSGASGSAFAMITMIILFFLMLSMLRGQMRDSGTERDDRDRVAVLTKADSSSSSSSSSGGPARRDDDHDRDMIQ